MDRTEWCRHQESNSGPADYKSAALPQLSYSGTASRKLRGPFRINTLKRPAQSDGRWYRIATPGSISSRAPEQDSRTRSRFSPNRLARKGQIREIHYHQNGQDVDDPAVSIVGHLARNPASGPVAGHGDQAVDAIGSRQRPNALGIADVYHHREADDLGRDRRPFALLAAEFV